MAKKLNSGIFKIWMERTKSDLTWLNFVMLGYVTWKSGYRPEWWHIALFFLFLVLRTVWDHKRVIHQQVDFWLGESKIINNIIQDLKEIKGK